MGHLHPRRLNGSEKAELWRRWRQGESLQTIGRALGWVTKCMQYVVAGAGGVPPPPRRRSRLALTSAEREEISRGLANGASLRAVSREVRRHGGRRQYRASVADTRAWAQSRRPKVCRLATRPALRAAVAAKLALEWAPQQIAGWLRHPYPDDPEMHVSHETIYLSLFVQSRGVLKKALVAHLRQRRTYRRPKGAAPHPGGHIVDAVSIRERPATADDRAVPGHWEGDLLVGARHSHVATLVERRSRYVCLIRLAGRDTQTVVRALTQHVRRLPKGLMATLTWDRGYELAHHRAFSIATGVQVYFCDPQSPWQRGTNENTNGLLRQYFPTGTDLSDFSQRQLDAIARRLNTRPRKTLGYRTPADILAETVASTA